MFNFSSMSAHQLCIECDRYYGETMEQRLIENEIDFVCNCKKYDVQRLQMFQSLETLEFRPSEGVCLQNTSKSHSYHLEIRRLL